MIKLITIKKLMKQSPFKLFEILFQFIKVINTKQMHSSTDENINIQNDSHIKIDIIKQTRKLIRGMTEEQRFAKAKRHLEDALAFKTPRPDTYSSELSKVSKFIYTLQTAHLWQTFLFILSYIFMYLIVLQDEDSMNEKIGIEIAILLIMWIDVFFQIYHKKFEVLRISSKFQTRFYIRIIILIFLTVDELIFIALDSERPIRPFRVLRSCLPIFYDTVTRKTFEALFSSYQDIFVYVVFYSVVIICFALVGNQVIEIPKDIQFDDYTQNYGDFGKMIFSMYVLSSYDAYPDNQIPAIQSSFPIYWFFILFIFLNVFLFVTIPTTILFNSFRQTRSKIILIDEIKQQHSLILAFVSLGEDDFNIKQEKLIKFLLYVYKNKVRYVDYITEVCLKLDDNNNDEIQVNEFMQLCKILQSNSSMLPPSFHDWDRWIRLRKWLNQNLKLKAIILSDKFKVFIAIFIIISFINCLLSIFTDIEAFKVIDDVFIGLYCFQILFKILGLGPENFFKNKWNKLDFFIIAFVLGLELAPNKLIPNNSDVLFKMIRIFRITTLIKLISNDGQVSKQGSIYKKVKKLFSQIAIIIPIVIKFIPLYLISYYVLGVIGMEIFYEPTEIKPSQSPYSMYDEFSNFNYFMGSQLVFVQVLVEAGWSAIAYDHAYRYGYFGLVMLYFVFCHIIIVIVLSSLLKGMAWQVYSTIHEQFTERISKREKMQAKEAMLKKKKQDLEYIKAKVDDKEILQPDTIISRELLQNKMDIGIFQKLKQLYDKNQQNIADNSKKQIRCGLIHHFIQNKSIMMEEISLNDMYASQRSSFSNHDMIIHNLMETKNLTQIEELEEEDIEEEMEKILCKIILNPKLQFIETIAYPKVLTKFLQTKIKTPFGDPQKEGFDIEEDMISNFPSIKFLTYELNVLMGIEKSERQQKTMILEKIVEENILTEKEAANLLTKRNSKVDGFDVNWIIRKMFLSNTNQDLIKKFEIQYFSSVYGKSFREINKVTIEPLLRLQSRLTYCFKNALRYKDIDELSFFTILSNIEDSMSNKLLKKGSLFKFVFQVDLLSDTWFSIQLRESKQLKIHFIKNGIWVYHRTMRENEIYYGKDLFEWEFRDRVDKNECQKYIKMLFQSFQSLAFCLIDQKTFFQTSPLNYMYDLYSLNLNVEETSRYIHRRLAISKIMLVVLSKQDERLSRLEYELSDLVHENDMKKQFTFDFDESENETFLKLKKMELLDYQKIVESEGLPFSFVMNMMNELQDTMNLYKQNFVHQVQKVLNSQFDEI